MLTFQDFTAAVEKGRLLPFLRDAIVQHRRSEPYRIAVIADDYDRQRNTTINDAVRRIYSIAGVPVEDFTASNNRIASNYFRRLNVQRCSYSLGNGITLDGGIKDRLGADFDTDLYNLAYTALKHGVAYGFWDFDQMHVFPLTEFVPLTDETNGVLRAGIRFWSLDWQRKPVFVELYEEDGFTKYRSKGGKTGLALEEVQPKRGYKQTIQHTDAGEDEVIGEENYGALPIVPMWGNRNHQSTLVGMRAAIDSYDMIQSGFANDLADCAQVYWILGNALGMEDADVQRFMDRIRLAHVAVADTDNSSVQPYTQEIPYNAREAYLKRIEASIYRDFGAFNPTDVAAGNITATQINAAYQPMDEEADDFEYQVIDFVRQILRLNGLDGVPTFKRNRITNQTELTQMILSAAQYIDQRTVLEKLPWITTDEIDEILGALDAEDAGRYGGEGGTNE